MNKEHKDKLSDSQPHAKQRPPQIELEDLYFNKNLTQYQIADFYGVGQWVVTRWFKRYDIKARRREDYDMPIPPKDEKHWAWKGDRVTYSALHSYIRSRLGTPMKCEHCRMEDKKKYEWANISKEYKRDLDDWVRLCTKCHRAFDSK